MNLTQGGTAAISRTAAAAPTLAPKPSRAFGATETASQENWAWLAPGPSLTRPQARGLGTERSFEGKGANGSKTETKEATENQSRRLPEHVLGTGQAPPDLLVLPHLHSVGLV